MRTEYLYEFILLSKNGNFQSAADALFISQSSLSKHIQSIESELGFALIDHNKTKFSLTPDGMEFLPYAQKICDLRQEYTELFKNRGKTRILDVGTCHFTAVEDDLFSDVILKISEKYPDCLIHTPPVLATDNIDELLINSDRGKLSCLIAKTLSTETVKVTSSLIETKTIYKWPVSVLTRKDHPLAGKEISLHDIVNEQLISLAYPTFANSLAVKAFRSVGLIPVFSNTLNSFRSICDLVSNNRGIFLVTESISSSRLNDDLCITKITPEITAETFVAYNKLFNKDFELDFLDILINEFQAAMPKNF